MSMKLKKFRMQMSYFNDNKAALVICDGYTIFLQRNSKLHVNSWLSASKFVTISLCIPGMITFFLLKL